MAGEDNGASEPRRSGRSTKGQHTRNAELNEEAPAPAKKTPPATKKNTKTTRAKSSKSEKGSSPAPTATTDENSDEEEDGEIIRCVCGADTDEGGRQMIQCDGCNAWQHSSCMQIPTKHTPEEYYCEQCKPELHKDLLERMARGEKPWERRGRKGNRKSVGATKRKKGSEAPEGTPATEGQPDEDRGEDDEKGDDEDVKMESPGPSPTVELETEPVAAEQATIAETEAEKTEEEVPEEPKQEEPEDVEMKEEKKEEDVFEKPAPPDESGRRRSSAVSPTATLKRKADESVAEDTEDAQDQSSPSRRTSVSQVPPSPTQAKGSKTRSTRRSSTTAAAKPPPPKKPKTVENQLELVTTMEELKSDTRRKGAETLKKFLEGALKPLEKLPEGETSKTEFATRMSLEIEHYTYILLSGQTPGEPNDEYRMKFRSILFNLKKNEPLLRNVLAKKVSTKEFSDMSGDEMATEDMKHIVQEAEKESEKQSILTAEAAGPRIRRTHKGEELVGEDNGMVAENSTGFIGSRYEPPAERSDDEGSAPPSPGADDTIMTDHQRSPSPKPQDPADTPSKSLKIDTSSRPTPGHHRRTSSFDIQNVWSNVETAETEKGHRPSISRPPITPLTAHPANGNTSQLDRDIDMLLRNDGASRDGSETPPYSPKDYMDEAEEGSIWKGKVLMRGVADIEALAKHVAGPDLETKVGWETVVGDAIEITGRISIERANDYLSQLKYSSRSSDFVVFSLHPSPRASGLLGQAGFNKLFGHFKERQRSGVVGKPTWSPTKDVYVVAVGKEEAMPSFMQDTDFPTHPRETDALLLCIVFNRSLEPFTDNHTPTTGTPFTPQPPSRTAQTPVTAITGTGQFSGQQSGWQPPINQPFGGYQQSPTPINYFQGSPPQPVGAAPQVQDHQYQPPPAFPQNSAGASVDDLIRNLNLAPRDQAFLRSVVERNPDAASDPQKLMQLVQQEAARRG